MCNESWPLFSVFSLLKDYKSRPRFGDLLVHPFIVQYNEKEVDVAQFVSAALDTFGEEIQKAQ